MSRPTALVTDAGTASGITVVRSLARAGWRVVAADSSRRSPAFVSRHVSERRLVPSAEEDADVAIERLLAVIRATQPDLIMPVTDQVIFPLLDRAGELPATTRVAAAAREAMEVARSKDLTLALAERVGVPVPPWRLAENPEQALTAAAELGWPVVCKPVMSHVLTGSGRIETKGVTFARDTAHLERLLDAGSLGARTLIQTFVPGHGVGIDVLCHQGRLLAAFQHRRLREVPYWGGMSSLRASEPLDGQLLTLTRELLGELGWTGLAMVEFRTGPAGPVLMEINGRVWGSIALPVRAGMDFPARWADLIRNGPPADRRLDDRYRSGVRCRHFALELRWAAQALSRPDTPPGVTPPPRAAAVPVLAGLVDPRNEFDVQRLDDPLPGLVDAAAAWGAVLRRLVQGAGRPPSDHNHRYWSGTALADRYARPEGLTAPEAAFIALAPRLESAAVLDLGVGGGRTSGVLGPQVRRYVGVDYSLPMIEACRRRFAGQPLAECFEVADARDLSRFGDGEFDLVLFGANGLDYVDHEDRHRVWAELARVCAPGGLCGVSSHNRGALPSALSMSGLYRKLRATRSARRLPLALLRHGGRQLGSRLRNPTPSALMAQPWVVVTRGGARHPVQTYYVGTEEMQHQITRHGFEVVEVLDPAGHRVADGALQNSAQPWLFWSLRRAEPTLDK